MVNARENEFPTISTGVPKNPFATESKLDDLVWFFQKMTGPGLLFFSCIIGIFVVLEKVPETRVNQAERVFRLSLGSGLLAMGVNVTGLLAFGRTSHQHKTSQEVDSELIPGEQLNPIRLMPRSQNHSSQIEETRTSRAFLPEQESGQRLSREEQADLAPSTGFPMASAWRA